MTARARLLEAVRAVLPGATPEEAASILLGHEDVVRVLRDLGERVKELTALHGAASLLQDDSLSETEVLTRVAALLPPALLHPEDAVARVRAGRTVVATPGFAAPAHVLRSPFRTSDGQDGALEVGYLHGHPAEQEGPFLAEERRLLDTLAEMVAASLDRRGSAEHLREVLTTDLVRLWEMDVETGRITWPGIAEASPPDPPLPLTLTRDQALETVHPDDRAALSGALEAALADTAGPGKFSADFRVARRRGEYRWRHLAGRVLRDASGRPQRVVGISTDIDKERALLDRIRQGDKMEALGHLAGEVAHDFNNLLNLILGYTQLAADRLPAEDPARRYLEHVTEAGDSATALVKQILAFGRRQALRPQELDLGTAVAQSEALITRLLGPQVEVRKELAADAPRAVVDPTQFQQVLLNLSVNARDAMPRGGRITWRVRGSRCGAPLPDGRTGEPRDWATLEVEDTGSGIPPELRARVFEPFFTTKPEGQGTGLGLATVHGIVTQSGGFLELESEVGRGSLFRVRFPATGAARRERGGGPVGRAPARAPEAGGGRRPTGRSR